MADSIIIAASTSAGFAAFLCCVCVPSIVCCIFCYVKCVKSKRSSTLHYPKFRVIDAPNPSFINKKDERDGHSSLIVEGSNGFVPDNIRTEEDISERSPAKLPSDIEMTTSESYSYALPSEIRFQPFQGKNLTIDDDDSETVPIRRHRSSTDSQIPSRVVSYGSTSPTDCADYVSPVSSPSYNSPSPSTAPIDDSQDLYMTPATNQESLYMQINSLNVPHIDRDSIEIQGQLGSGNFGCVVECVYHQSPSHQRNAAAKTLKETSVESDTVRFLQEAAIMGQFHHQNVVKVFGVVVTGTPLMIVLELMPKGDLRNFLTKIKPGHNKLAELLLKFCRQVASGMEYLSSKCFIHRDVAARNILLSEDLKCKIGDFGLARDLMDEEYYIAHGGVIPVRWTAPEALNYRKYSTASDVWSFGCLLYEIWSLGHKPYGRRTNKEILTLLEEGCRLHPPPGCTRSLYHLMIQCWHPSASSRPSFTDVVHILNNKDEQLLSWSESDKHCCGPDGKTLGSSLVSSESLYIDLQLTYSSL